ncbi:uncharacterized protein C8A04DRAFT_15429 [Dichotomopilus funicola]|uniref:Centrosomin N-terminal motif 1 domain-containing protein n=1 Tax=Dichotomopilus funicola TaxID=1934379 RepID=A0AAN6UWQ3_9PEZI|nr:hypothetical protein C8A04DRAFT_15429 [Dichotomopilus funicola]
MESYGPPQLRSSSASNKPHRINTEHDPSSSPASAISPLLLERLQRSRKIESDRMSSQSSADKLSSSAGSRHVRSPSPSNSYRPSSGEAKKGLGVKEMEQTLSTLHKQNFDLKLELYHRREKQAALEERMETLERELKERDQLNDSLVHELEKRDKAVEEAIDMIVTLEKRVEQLLLERKMVQQVETDDTAYPRIASPVNTPTPKQMRLDPGDAKTPVRMPSFVSERSENADNLREVYLGAIAGESALHLPRLAEDTPETTRVDPRLASPALSDLSESSFVSVYGRTHTVDVSSPPRGYSPWPWEGDSSRTPAPIDSPTKVRTSTPSNQQRANSSRTASGPYHSIVGMLEPVSSPLQRVERLGSTPTPMRASSGTPTGAKQHSPSVRPQSSHNRPKSKKEKREALEKVLTQVQFSSPQTLPPTPDTLSTSTLPQNDSPPRDRQYAENGRSFLSLTGTNTSRASGQHEPKPPSRAGQTDTPTLHPTLALVGGRVRDDSTPGGDGLKFRAHHRRVSTTSSVDTWLRESMKPEDTDGLDPMSSASQADTDPVDERLSPDLFSFPPSSKAGWAADAMFGALAGKGYKGYSPTTASIPADTETVEIYTPPLPRSGVPNGGRMTPVRGTVAPPVPPPNRRSSLFARTGVAAADVSPGTEGISQPSSSSRAGPSSSPYTPYTNGSNTPATAGRSSRSRSNSTDARSSPAPRHHSTELGLKQDRAMTVPPKQLQAPPPAAPMPPRQHNSQDSPSSQPLPGKQQRHYPPPAQSSRPRSRGLNSFFRRSISGSGGPASAGDLPAPPASAPPTETAFRPPPPQGQAARNGSGSTSMSIGMPSWVRRGSVGDEERTGATPPPILRSKAGGVMEDSPGYGHRGTGATEEEDLDGGVALENGAGTHYGLSTEVPSTGVNNGSGGAPVATPPAKKSTSRRSWGGSNGSVLPPGIENPEMGGASLANSSTSSGGGGGGKRKWLGLGRVSSLRNRGGA